jgi:hypothetical protein
MMISDLGIGFSGQAIVDYDIPDLFHLMGIENQNQRQSPRSYKPRVGHPRRIELRAEETEKSLLFLFQASQNSLSAEGARPAEWLFA